MENVLLKEREWFKSGHAVICPVELDLSYELLDGLNEVILKDAAMCLAETFAGMKVGGIIVSEPMTKACGLSVNSMYSFVLGYLESVVNQGLCYVARDKQTGGVVGVLACEDFNQEEEAPVFKGDLKPLNTIISFLAGLDERFLETIYQKTGKKATPNEYIHTFMAGVRMGNLKRFVIIKLFELLIKDGCKRNFKGMFGEATNFKSMKMMTDYCGFHPVTDIFKNPIRSLYSEHKTFKMIPKEVSTDCRILYRPLFPQYDL